MNTQEQYIRYPSGVSEEKLSKRFGLYWDRTMQDWEFVVSDSGRIDDFLKVYQTELDNDDDKFTLMGLIVSSFDDDMTDMQSGIENKWAICKTILEKECFLHFSIIRYWSLLDEKDIHNVFSITPYIREVWEEVKTKFL